MPLPLIRYQEDPTGLNSDNTVIGEVHSLSTAQIRAVAPTYGPFFTESIVIYDHGSNRLLVRGQDYQIVELLQDATLKFGKEIAQLILITDHTVTSSIRINYQVLGGLYLNSAAGIVTMYENIMLDQRPVDWVNVLNQPTEYPPTLHNHLIEDVYGFEPLVVALERIRNAIVVSDVPAYEALINWVKGNVVTQAEIDAGSSSNKYVTFDRLLYALDKLNFNGITISPSILAMVDGTFQSFTVSSTNLPDNTVLYWTIEHTGTTDADFSVTSGVVNIVGNRGSFNLALNKDIPAEPAESFKIVLRKNGITGYIMAKTGPITIAAHARDYTTDIIKYLNACCIYRLGSDINPTSLFIAGE